MYVGGAKWQPGTLLLQQKGGTFRAVREPGIAADSLAEDVDAAFFDADGDGDLDLYVVSAGNEFSGQDNALLDRLYVNDGHGSFHKAPSALPAFFDNGSCVVPGDFDGDGDIDLFVGSRVVAGKYGTTPRSHLLRNDGKGQFTEVTDELAPGLGDVGMVTSATWMARPGTKALDLVVVGEWMPVRVFRQESGRFADRTAESEWASKTEGWWNSVTSADLNGDGRPDLVLGNLGLNSYLRASPNEPARLYVADFAHNGTLQQILTFYKHGVSYPVAGRDDLLRLIPSLRSKYPSYKDFGASRGGHSRQRSSGRRSSARRVFASSVAIAQADGTYRLQPLPVEAQFSPVMPQWPGLRWRRPCRPGLAGNLYGAAGPRVARQPGVLLRGLGDGRFTSADAASPVSKGKYGT
jgi:hypothetical protein